MRLNAHSVSRLPLDISHFGYDRAEQAVGIVHFGIGAFHRAHQAWYTDRAMDEGDRDWAIAAISMRSSQVAAQLNPQNGLYTVTERSDHGLKPRLVGAVREVLVAPQAPAAVIAALAAPTTRIVSFTITEKGYCRSDNGGLDVRAAGESSVYMFAASALRRRMKAGLPGLTFLSCDNLAANGRQLAGLMGQYLDRRDPALRGWFEAECACPSTMVDRIVPATTEADRSELARMIGVADEAAVMTEPFSQWVIEDHFAGDRPSWEKAGAELVSDVRSYEAAKLRMLNGAHSLLAYCGLQRGYAFVHEAIADPELRRLAAALMIEEAAPTVGAAPGQDLRAYAEGLLARFANPALNHRLIQIAMDGSQKIPQRWLETLAANQRQGRECPAIRSGIGAWIRHLRGANGLVNDPRTAELAPAAAGDGALAALFGPTGLLASQWEPGPSDVVEIMAALN